MTYTLTLTDVQFLAVPLALDGQTIDAHRLDTMNQDSNNACICGSIDRSEQRFGDGRDPKWNTMDEHRIWVMRDYIENLVNRQVKERLDKALLAAVSTLSPPLPSEGGCRRG